MVSPIPVGAFHASRQLLARMLDFQEVARNTVQMDAALAQATANTEGYLHRGFFPWRGTRTLNYPDIDNSANSYAIRLDDNEFASLTAVTSGGVSLSLANLVYFPQSGPPYNRVETNLNTSSVFSAGSTWQSSTSFTGLWCGTSAATRPVSTLSAGVNASVTSLPVSDVSLSGVGDVLLVDSEYMVVTALTSSTSGQTLQTPLTASAANTTVAVTTGSAYAVGEVVTLDSERMLIVDITGNNLTVKRAWDGSVLATHTGSTIFYYRTLTVTRGACGTSAASHSSAAVVNQHLIPQPVQALTLAEAMWLYQNQAQAYQIAPGTTSRATTQVAALAMVQDARDIAMRAAGRKGRQRAV